MFQELYIYLKTELENETTVITETVQSYTSSNPYELSIIYVYILYTYISLSTSPILRVTNPNILRFVSAISDYR